MRIAINAALVGVRYSGTGTYISCLTQSLADLGHEITVYTSSSQFQADTRITFKRSPSCAAFDAGPLSGLLRLFWNLVILPIKLAGTKVDALVSQNAEGTAWCSVPQVLVIHDLIPLFYPEEAPCLRRYYKTLLPLILKNTAAVVAVSQHTRTDLLHYYKPNPAHVHVAYDGSNPTIEKELTECPPIGFPSKPYFLFIGTFAPRKNLETVIRALAQVQGKVPESLLIVAYPDKWMQGSLHLAEELGLKNRIVHVSGLASEELTYVYRHATALFLLSEYEGFGLPALEAMLAGTPAVVSDSTALAEVVGDGALKIGAHDITAAAGAMLRLSTDSAYREDLQRLGVRRAGTFTWARTAETVSEILSQIVQPRNNSRGLPDHNGSH